MNPTASEPTSPGGPPSGSDRADGEVVYDPPLGIEYRWYHRGGSYVVLRAAAAVFAVLNLLFVLILFALWSGKVDSLVRLGALVAAGGAAGSFVRTSARRHLYTSPKGVLRGIASAAFRGDGAPGAARSRPWHLGTYVVWVGWFVWLLVRDPDAMRPSPSTGLQIATGLQVLAPFVFWALLYAALVRKARSPGGGGRYVSSSDAQVPVWGTAGAGSDADAVFGAEAASLGRLGERHLAQYLARHLAPRFPAARFFHSLVFIGSVNADVDHAVAVGDRVALLDSKAWRAGHYTWASDGSLRRDGHPFPGCENHMGAMITAYENTLDAREAHVAAWVVLTEPSRGDAAAATTFDNTGAPDRLRLATPVTLVEDLSEWFTVAPSVVDRGVVYSLVTLLKY